MTPFTDEEYTLADDLQKNAKRLARLALSGNDVGLVNDLEMMVANAISSRSQKRADDPRRRAVRGFEKPSMRKPVGLRRRRFEGFETDDEVLLERVDPQTLETITDVLTHPGEKAQKSRLQIAQRMIRAYPNSREFVKTFIGAINMIKRKLGLQESTENFGGVLQELRRLNERDDDDHDNEGTSAPSKDRDTGEILYHLDMSTRHLDVLVDYTLIAGHEDQIVRISSAIQKLAQQLRSELEAQRTPLDKR